MHALRNTRGFTLVELMIAMVLSSIVVAAAFALFINANRVYSATGLEGQTQQNARAALDIMSNELVMAGFGTPDPIWVADIQVVNEREDEMPLTTALANSADGSDRLQFKAGLGGMAIVVQEAPLASLVGSGPGAGAVVHDVQGHDLLTDGALVEVFNLERERLGTGVLGALSTLPRTSVSFSAFVVDANQTALSSLPIGALIIQRPMYITYFVDEQGNLVRASSSVRGVDNFESSYVLARGVHDLQFSYLLGADTEQPGLPTGWQPAPGGSVDMTNIDNRRRVRAIRVDLLLRSEAPNPMLSPVNCTTGFSKRVYFQGDRAVDVGNLACRHTFVQMSTIVHTPNLFAFRAES